MAIFNTHPTLRFSNISGSCLCKAITYTLNGPLIYHTLCSCPNCRKATGSLIGAETMVPSSTLTILTGKEEIKTYTDKDTESGTPMERQFCGRCGSQLFVVTPLLEGCVSVFAGGWVKEERDWSPMREQFAGCNVLEKLLKLPKELVRTRTGPLSEVIGRGEKAV